MNGSANPEKADEQEETAEHHLRGQRTNHPVTRNLGTERNRDHVVKRETPQGEEITGNPSSGKDKKTRNNCRPKQD